MDSGEAPAQRPVTLDITVDDLMTEAPLAPPPPAPPEPTGPPSSSAGRPGSQVVGSAQLAGGGAGTVLCDAGFPSENLIFTKICTVLKHKSDNQVQQE